MRGAAACAALFALCSGCGGTALPAAKVVKAGQPDPLPGGTACYRLVPSASRLEVDVGTLVGDYTLRFGRYRGEVRAARDPTVSRLWLELDTRSLSADTQLGARAARSSAFLDVARFPRACFVTEHVARDTDQPQTYRVRGVLSLHGVRRSIALPVRIARSGKRYVVLSHFSLDRGLFDIRAPGVVDDMVKSEVAVQLELVGEDCPKGGTVSSWWHGCAAAAPAPHSASQETK